MNKIHQCEICGGTQDAPMSGMELERRFDDLESRIDRARSEASDKGHGFIILALIILLLRGC
jgi:hypothetical protein